MDPGRVYYPDLYAAVGVHSGLPSGAASDLSSAFDAMRVGAKAAERRDRVVPAIIFHGYADPIVHPSNGDALAAQALGRATGVLRTREHGRAPGGHAYVRIHHLCRSERADDV